MIEDISSPGPDISVIIAYLTLFVSTVVALLMAGKHEPEIRYIYVEGEGDMTEKYDDEEYEQAVLPFQEEAHTDLVERLRACAKELGKYGANVTSDDVHKRIAIPKGVDRRIMGSVFKPRKDWVHVGVTKSERKGEDGKSINHGRPISVWRLRQTEAA